MKIWLAILLLLCTISIKAQDIIGKITDKNNNPIEFATIVVQTTDSVYVNSAYTDSLGIFTAKTNRIPFLLTIQHLMYETYQNKYDSSMIGEIQMNEKSQMLSEVSVTAKRPVVRVIDGKMTYDMPQLLLNKMASNAYEALLELPGVSEQNDAINLAGANGVSVIINGKSTTMDTNQLITLLKNMPKERILSAEVMYSAPPQYHVRGAAINLVLDSGTPQESQFRGQVNGAYNQEHYASYQGGTSLITSTPKMSTDFMYSFDYKRTRNGNDIISNHLYQSQMYNIDQYDRGSFRIPTHNIRLGNEWFLNEKNKISLVYTAQIQQWSHSFNP